MSGWAKKRRVMRRYDQSAKVYDAQYCEEQDTKIRTAIENLTLNRNREVLDVGCGTGLLFEHIVEKTKLIVGIDLSRCLLKEAKKRAGINEKVALVLADADNMPFANHVFDATFSITLLQNMPNAVATLNEIKRVSKPDATVVVSGLRKAFTKDEFSKMLKRVDLEVAVLKLDKRHREYIAACIKKRR